MKMKTCDSKYSLKERSGLCSWREADVFQCIAVLRIYFVSVTFKAKIDIAFAVTLLLDRIMFQCSLNLKFDRLVWISQHNVTFKIRLISFLQHAQIFINVRKLLYILAHSYLQRYIYRLTLLVHLKTSTQQSITSMQRQYQVRQSTSIINQKLIISFKILLFKFHPRKSINFHFK
ncbi:Hypothetical_protein [Hexamita inflata]|uniref:Hypothetical_protein n=1 Tax=Hexamita inflata TaxID=28002 RepID=A0AA86UPF3_9EUKA|nr:Hypothetical protein HINF_LOCUS50669 [Hexamita inflata]